MQERLSARGPRKYFTEEVKKIEEAIIVPRVQPGDLVCLNERGKKIRTTNILNRVGLVVSVNYEKLLATVHWPEKRIHGKHKGKIRIWDERLEFLTVLKKEAR